jgi:hypothetical protein
MSKKLTPDSLSTIELSIATERLRQARYSFNTALSATTASFFISLVRAGLFLSNKISEGAVTATGGLLASKVILLLYLAVGGSEAAQVRIPFILTAIDVVAAQIEKRLEASEEEQQEKRSVKRK